MIVKITASEELILEALRAINELSERFFPALEQAGTSRWTVPLTYEGYYGGIRILCFGETIWSSEEDERDFSEGTNTWEPIKDYIVRQMSESLRASAALSPILEELQGPQGG